MNFARLVLLATLIGSGIVGWAYWSAVSDPIVRSVAVEMLSPESPETHLRILLLSDIHVAGPDMSPERLGRIVGEVNAQNPDVVLIAGDFVSDKQFATKRFSFNEAIAPLRQLTSRFGTFAVLGNHDHWRNAAAAHAALRGAGINVLDNSAARAGPLAIGGLDDAFTNHDDLNATLRAMTDLGGQPILLSHSPDPFPRVPANVKLMLAGHTHCGQIRLPLVGAMSYMSEHGERYACGVVVENGKTLVVGAGLGTSILPLRLGAAPDMWVITITRRSRSSRNRR